MNTPKPMRGEHVAKRLRRRLACASLIPGGHGPAYVVSARRTILIFADGEMQQASIRWRDGLSVDPQYGPAGKQRNHAMALTVAAFHRRTGNKVEAKNCVAFARHVRTGEPYQPITRPLPKRPAFLEEAAA